MGECIDGKKYSVVASDVLSSPYREGENWKKLLEANQKLSKRISPNGEYSAVIFPRDSICIPQGMVVADFIDNGDYAPTLVPYNGPAVTTLAPSVISEPWYSKPWTLFFLFIPLGLLVVGVIYRHTHGGIWRKRAAVREHKNKKYPIILDERYSYDIGDD